MTNKKTKRALLASVMAMLLCFTMLLGTTFAWFTDSASTAVNKSQAGTLDVKLLDEYGTSLEGKTLSWQKAAGHENEDVLWEPGCTYKLQPIVIKNAGNLALKYKIVITGIQGYAELNEAIEWTITNASATTALDEDHPLAAGTSDTLTISGRMKESAGNEYQGLSIDGIGITVLATQDTVESDSFNNQYDKDAVYGDVMVSSDAELKAAIEDPAMKVIAVNGDLTYDWGSESYENSKALNMNGKTFLGANDVASITFAGYGSANPIVNATFKDITIKDITKGDNESSWEHGYLEFKNLTAVNVTFANSIMMEGDFATFKNCSFNSNKDNEYAVWVANGDATFEGCTFTGPRGVKVHEAYGSEVGTVVIDNNTFAGLTQKPGVVIGTVNAATTIKITNNVFAATQPGDQNNYKYETDTDVTTFNFVDENNTVNGDLITTADQLVAAINAGAKAVILAEGDYALRFTNNTNFNLNDMTIKGLGDVNLAISSSEAWYGRVQGSNVTFENIHFTSSVGATGKATYNNCTFDDWTICASSNNEETTFNNCTINGCLNTSTDFSSGDVFVNNCKIAKAEYSGSMTMNFVGCQIDEIIIWNANTNLTNCQVTKLDNSNVTNATVTIK